MLNEIHQIMKGSRACSVYPEIYLNHCLRGGSIVSNDLGAPRRLVAYALLVSKKCILFLLLQMSGICCYDLRSDVTCSSVVLQAKLQVIIFISTLYYTIRSYNNF